MIEILFRGKRVDNGEWVYGYVWKNPREQYFITEYNTLTMYAVTPETIGQYTGIADTNGNKIFEGDVAVCQGGEYYHGTWEYESTEIVKDIRSMGFLEYCEKAIIIGNIHDKEEANE